MEISKICKQQEEKEEFCKIDESSQNLGKFSNFWRSFLLCPSKKGMPVAMLWHHCTHAVFSVLLSSMEVHGNLSIRKN